MSVVFVWSLLAANAIFLAVVSQVAVRLLKQGAHWDAANGILPIAMGAGNIMLCLAVLS